jgi:hypothetical protein
VPNCPSLAVREMGKIRFFLKTIKAIEKSVFKGAGSADMAAWLGLRKWHRFIKWRISMIFRTKVIMGHFITPKKA